MQQPPKELETTEAKALAQVLLSWFEQNKRPLPWREQYQPYQVWISEIMLQQTQMERGIGYYMRWMQRFPDVASVAAAPEDDILHAWEGLGYYRRARFLHAAAKVMVERHAGTVPEDAVALTALPGLGPYTVAAIRGIAFNHDVVVVDANVERVFSRLLNIGVPPKKPAAAKAIRQAATALLPSGYAREYNQALMEFGALVCKKIPQCGVCPLQEFCDSRRLGVERQRPVLETKAEIIPVLAGFGVLIAGEHALVCKRPESGLWGGLWEFPGDAVRPGENPEQAACRVFADTLGLNVRIEADLGTVKHGYTNHRLCAHYYRLSLIDSRSPAVLPDQGNPGPALLGKGLAGQGPPESGAPVTRWVDCRKTGELAMPAHHRKLADRHFSDKIRKQALDQHIL